jgi:hypothetical protein
MPVVRHCQRPAHAGRGRPDGRNPELQYRPLVSRDVVADPRAACPTPAFGWYDNEQGYTCRLADPTAIVGGRL